MKKITFTLLVLVLINSSFSQNALHFDGTNDYVQTNYSGVTGTANRTFEAWIYLSATPTANTCILDYGANAVGSRNTFYVNSSRRLGYISGGTNANVSSTNSNVVPINQWAHVAFVMNSGTGYLYVNGIQVGTGNLSTVNTPTSGTNLRIGQRVTGGSIPFKGSIDEVRIWNVARTSSEIQSTMNNEFCSAPSSLTAYYSLNHGIASGTNTTVTSAADSSVNSNNGTLLNFALTGTTSNWVNGKNISPATIDSSFTITACGSYTMPNGQVITLAGTYFDTISTSSSCDSLDSYTISFIPAIIKNTINDTGCISYTTPMGNLITTAGTYYDTISSSMGCDTVIQYNIALSGAVDDSVYRVGARMTSWDTWATHQWVRCDSNYQPILGETNHFYIASQAGDYAVIVTRGTCVDTSDCINISLTSLDEKILSSISIYPNPANGLITIQSSTNILGNKARIYAINGKLIKEVSLTDNTISLSGLSSGIFYLSLSTPEGIAKIKFVKQ